jgi:hypothetical protein
MVGEINTASNEPDDRHDNVVDQRLNKAGEGRPDYEADGEIDEIATKSKLGAPLLYIFSCSNPPYDRSTLVFLQTPIIFSC